MMMMMTAMTMLSKRSNWLAEQYLGGTLGEYTEAAASIAPNYSSHRFTCGVERVDFTKRLLRVTLPDGLIVATEALN